MHTIHHSKIARIKIYTQEFREQRRKGKKKKRMKNFNFSYIFAIGLRAAAKSKGILRQLFLKKS